MDNGNNRLVPADRNSAPLVRVPERGYGYGYGYAGAQDESDGFHLREYLRIIRKNKWMILTLVVVATTLVAVAAYKVQDTYVATATVLVGDESPNVLPSAQPVYVYDFDGKRFNTQLRMLQQPDLVREAVIEMDLENTPNVFSRKPATLSQAFTSMVTPGSGDSAKAAEPKTLGAPIDPNQPLDDATKSRLAPYVGVVIGGLSVRPVKDTQLITISFEHHDPEVAAKVANTVAKVFAEKDLKQRVDTKSSASKYLSERIASLQGEIQAGEQWLINYGETHDILSLDDESQNIVVQELATKQKELLDAQAKLRDIEAQRQALAQSGATEDFLRLPLAQTDAGAKEVSARLTTLRAKESELAQKYQDEWPELKAVREQIAQAEEELAKVQTRIRNSFEGEHKAAQYKVQKLEAEFNNAYAKTNDQNQNAISWRLKKQEVETNKKTLDDLLARQKDVLLSVNSEVSPIKITNMAAPPGGPAGPDRERWILTAFAGALITGVGLAFGREYLDQTIKSLDDVDRVVRLPSLGVIPAMGAKPRRALSAGAGAKNGNSAALITSLEAKSSAAEAYRQLRTSVLLSSAGHPSKLLLVTSSQPREGKTTTAVNTAISLAQTGASTLIIDADMRKPRVHHLLNASNHVGLSLYLSGQNEDLSVLIQPHQIPNLSVMPCGPTPPNPAELLGSEQMRKLLADLCEQFDHIVIDTPPVVQFADPVILSTMVDGVILVVRGGFSSRGIVLRSRQILTDVGAKIYGVVLNDADMKANDSYYYYGSYYGGYYEQEKESER